MLNIIDDFKKERSKLNDFKQLQKKLDELRELENKFIAEILEELKIDKNVKNTHTQIKKIKDRIFELTESKTGKEVTKFIKELHFILDFSIFQDIKNEIEIYRNDINMYIDKILYYLQTDFITELYNIINNGLENMKTTWLGSVVAFGTKSTVNLFTVVYILVSNILSQIDSAITKAHNFDPPNILKNKDNIIGIKAIETANEVNKEVEILKKKLSNLVRIEVESQPYKKKNSTMDTKHSQTKETETTFFEEFYTTITNMKKYEKKISPINFQIFEYLEEKIFDSIKNIEEKKIKEKKITDKEIKKLQDKYDEEFAVLEDAKKVLEEVEAKKEDKKAAADAVAEAQNAVDEALIELNAALKKKNYKNKIKKGIDSLTEYLEFKIANSIKAEQKEDCNTKVKNLSKEINERSKILKHLKKTLEGYFLKEENEKKEDEKKKKDFDNFFYSVITNYTLNNILLGILKLINNKLTVEFNDEINKKLIDFIKKSKKVVEGTKNEILQNFEIKPGDNLNNIKETYKKEVEEFIKKLKDLLETENITTFFEIINGIKNFQKNFFPIPILVGIIDGMDKNIIDNKINELNNYLLTENKEEKVKEAKAEEKAGINPEIINVIKQKTKTYIIKMLKENVEKYDDKFKHINLQKYIKFIINNKFTELAIYKLLVLSLNLINSNINRIVNSNGDENKDENKYEKIKEINTKITSTFDTIKKTGKILKNVGTIGVGATVLLAANKAFKTAKKNSIKKSINIAKTDYDNILFKLSNFIINSKTDKHIYDQLIKYADKTKNPRLAVFMRKLANDSAKIEGILDFIKNNPDILTEKNNVREKIINKINNKLIKYGGRKQNIFKKVKNIMMKYVIK